jgi:hypothetical protein
MQTLLFTAGILAVVTGLAHSVLGEILIFRHLRRGSLLPNMDAPPLRQRNIRIIWASWHVLTLFGWSFAAILFRLSFASPGDALFSPVAGAIVVANLGGSLLVLIGTRGRHPGWIALLLVAALTWIATSAS